jgi:dTDP-4-amino-4,6-dideoxy-D-galactose acyltransferase
MPYLEKMIEKRKAIWYHYSPYSFLPFTEEIYKHSFLNELVEFEEDNSNTKIEILIDGESHLFYIQFLSWDTNFFEIETYKLKLILFSHSNYSILKKAIAQFVKLFFKENNKKHVISEIPSEDIWVIQALNESGFKLVETRLTYYLDLGNYNFERFPVRLASSNDIISLKQVASEMRNVYDRFHSDDVYDLNKADNFLSTYIENSINGFADCCIVPDIDQDEPGAFLTANYLNDKWPLIEKNVSKMVLSAVSSEKRKGWYIKLISEMAYHLKSIGCEYVFMHPATTNRAVIRTYEKLGCKYGKAVHVLTKH